MNDNHRQQQDYDLHGLVGIRLLNATAADTAVVTRQLGPIQAPLTRQPDIIIRFVDRLPLSSPLFYLGIDDAAFTQDAFLLLRSKHKTQARVQIPFDRIGQRCEILCETGLPAVPLLISILNLTILGKGILPLHASAFIYKGTGVLVTGWAKGGKTETLLAFMAQGAAYVGDEWIYIANDGRHMFGIPEPMRVWDWHLDDLPQYRARAGRSDRARLRALRLLTDVMDRVGGNGRASHSLAAKSVNRLATLLKRQQFLHFSPPQLFGAASCPLVAPLDKIFFVISHDEPDVTVRPMDVQEVAQRMVFSLQAERLELLAYYWKYRFAFPEMANELIEQAESIQRERLLRVMGHMMGHKMGHKDAYIVTHPYPAPIPKLFEAISPYCRKGEIVEQSEQRIKMRVEG